MRVSAGTAATLSLCAALTSLFALHGAEPLQLPTEVADAAEGALDAPPLTANAAAMAYGKTYLLTELTVDQARELIVRYENRPLDLSGLETIDVDVAKMLAKHKPGPLQDVRQQTVRVKKLHSRRGTLGYENNDADPPVTYELETQETTLQKKTLDLSGLTALPPEVARALAKYRGNICLDGVENLDPDVSHELLRFRQKLLLRNAVAKDSASRDLLARHATVAFEE